MWNNAKPEQIIKTVNFKDLTTYEQIYNYRARKLCEYPIGVTIENVNEDFINLFENKEECNKFITNFPKGPLLRYMRFG